MSWEKWWVYDPGILIREWSLWPEPRQTYPEQLNSLTRCLLIICLILFIAGKRRWAIFLLIVGLLAIIVLGYQMQMSEKIASETRAYNFANNAAIMDYLGSGGISERISEVPIGHGRSAALTSEFSSRPMISHMQTGIQSRLDRHPQPVLVSQKDRIKKPTQGATLDPQGWRRRDF